MILFYSMNHGETLYKNAALPTVKTDGIFSYQSALNG
jgi:hypothetical protein